MAEVPEVETLVRDLREAAVGRTSTETHVLQPTAVRFPSVDEYTALLTGRVILGSQRRAKYIRRRGVLKSVLLNQRVVAGLGNRDADESMWLAGIDPRRSAASLTSGELTRLHAAIGKVLNEGIALRGTQRDLFGRKGQAIHRRYIFEKGGEPCPRCGARIAYLRIGGRNSFYCPNCQH